MLAAPAGASLRLRLLLAAAALLVTAVHERTASEQQDLEYIEGSYVCPGSPSAKPPASGSKSLNAWARISVSTSASCEDVRAEVLARLNGQIQGTWADPHNFGLYTILNKERANVLSLQRATGDRLFTDALTLSFTADSDACIIHGSRRISLNPHLRDNLLFTEGHASMRDPTCTCHDHALPHPEPCASPARVLALAFPLHLLQPALNLRAVPVGTSRPTIATRECSSAGVLSPDARSLARTWPSRRWRCAPRAGRRRTRPPAIMV